MYSRLSLPIEFHGNIGDVCVLKKKSPLKKQIFDKNLN